MNNDTPMITLVLRGFVGARQVVERTICVSSQDRAWMTVAAYFGCDASYSECDRYTVDTYCGY